MPGEGTNNESEEVVTFEVIEARYLAQHEEAKENDRAASAFNMWENEVRNDRHYYNEWKLIIFLSVGPSRLPV